MGKPVSLLVIEDSEDDALLLVRELQGGGYDVIFERVDTPATMIAALNRQEWGLIIADYSMPHFSGMAALAIVKEKGLDLPFIFVSGKIGEDTAVAAMKHGAHDYIMKGNLKRLIPAIERELREAKVRREQKRADEAVRESEARYRSLIQGAVYGICRTSLEGRFLAVNQTLVQMLGYESEAELLGLDIATDVYRDTAERGRVIDLIQNQCEIEGVEAEWKRKDGRSITVRLSGRKVGDRHGSVSEFEFIVEDVTERRALEQQLRQAQKMEAVGRLAGGIAHDFNNLLGVIIGYSEILEERLGRNDPLRRKAEGIKKAGQHAASLTRQLLAFSRKQVFELRVLDLNTVVSDTLKMLQRLIGENVELITVPAPELGRIKADQGQIEQVIMNLAVNARDAMPRGGRLTIETANANLDDVYARQHPVVVPGSYVMLTVSDTGCGMDAETQARIFEPFFTTKEMGKGTGLGLATVYGVVKQSGGYIWLYSEPGKGSAFKIYFPRVWEVGAAPAPSKASEENARGWETILVVEDANTLRELARELLEDSGYTVLEAANGDDAVRLVEQHQGQIHLLLTDVVMPGIDGRKLAESLAHKWPEMKILYMSGYTDDAIVNHGMLEPGIALLQKPFTRETLTSKVRLVLEAGERGKQS